MKRFINRVIQEALLGLLLGASFVLAGRLVVGVVDATKSDLITRIASSLLVAVSRVTHLTLLAALIVLALLSLLRSRIASFFRRLFRSWQAGIITGVFPIWFALSVWFFLGLDHWDAKRFFLFAGVGLLPILAGWLVAWRRHPRTPDTEVRVPKAAPILDNQVFKREITFDLPIEQWDEDRLSRGPFIQSIAKLILKDRAPVLAIVGPLGEGKTSALNLLERSLTPRNDLIVLRFSSWLPGDEPTLAFSLFGTIAEGVSSRYLVPGLSNELKQFAALLVGAVPQVGQTLKEFLKEPSQVEQLRRLKRLLGELPIRMVVLVDEIDRMDSGELLLFLKAVRGVIDLPNLVYVCAFDKKSVIRLISEQDAIYGQLYLEKFFPIQVALPPADPEILSNFFDQELGRVSQTFALFPTERDKKAFDDALLPLWHACIKRYLSNFRRMTLFFNAFRESLKLVSSEVNPFDMLVLQLVKMMSEETYEFIYSNGPLFYEPSWRVRLWMERLSVDDRQEAGIRNKRLKAHFDSLPAPTSDWVTQLLRTIFPTVEQCLYGDHFTRRFEDAEGAAKERRIYHPDYFPRYFLHQVPYGLFGIAEMNEFITQMNSPETINQRIAFFRQTLGKLASNPWKRWSFLALLAVEATRLEAIPSEAVILGVVEISDSLERNFLGISEWGRARALLFAAAKRFSGTPKLQEVLVSAIRQATLDGFAADVVRYSTSMRKENDIIRDWQGVDEATIKSAFSERMKTKYAVGSDQEPPRRGDDLSPFFLWVAISNDDRELEVEYLRDRFRRNPIELGRFLGWALATDIMYQGDSLEALGKLFPVDELHALLSQHGGTQWLEQDREAVDRFLQLVRQRGGAQGA